MSTGTDCTDGNISKDSVSITGCCLVRHRFRYLRQEKVEVVTQCNGVSDIRP